MHPLVEDVHRAHPVPVGLIVTGPTAVGAARYLVQMATVRTRLRRVRITKFEEPETVTAELVR